MESIFLSSVEYLEEINTRKWETWRTVARRQYSFCQHYARERANTLGNYYSSYSEHEEKNHNETWNVF